MHRYPMVTDLEIRARRRIPDFAWAYLASGTGDEGCVQRNLDDLQSVQLSPRYMRGQMAVDTAVELFGRTYAAPFGVAPIGLSSMIWPASETLLAKCTSEQAIPYCLSTVAGADGSHGCVGGGGRPSCHEGGR